MVKLFCLTLCLTLALAVSGPPGIADVLNGDLRHPDRLGPELREDKHYKEYWEQYFLFEDGTLLTTEFSVVNLPFNKHRGLMLATLVRPDGTTYIIKNGRSPEEWSYQNDRFEIRLGRNIDHYIRGAFPEYQLKLHNSTAEVELDLTSIVPRALPMLSAGNKAHRDGKFQMVAYAPHFTATGRFRPGPEVGAPKDGPWISLGRGAGFGMRVMLDEELDDLMENWLRLFPLGSGPGPALVLSSVAMPKGGQDNMLYLLDGTEVIDGFRDVRVTYEAYGKDKDLGEYPVKMRITARGDSGTLEGVVTFEKKLEHFRLNEHMSSIERMLAKVYPSLNRYRYLADYNLVYKTTAGMQDVKGRALGEFVDILPPTVEKKKIRKKR